MNGAKPPLRLQIQTSPTVPPVSEASEESYTAAILFLARFFLEELDRRGPDWQPVSDSSSDMGDDLYASVRPQLPESFRTELSGGQVSLAAHLAYRAREGD